MGSSRLVYSLVLLLVVLPSLPGVAAAGRGHSTGPPGAPVPIGLAGIDDTPRGPIRQMGYGGRKTESEGVAQKLWAKALAIGRDEDGPAVLVTVDNCAVPGELTEEVGRRLEEKAGLARRRFVVCASHTHAGPCLSGAIPLIFGEPIPPDHQERIDRYTRRFADCLEQVALAALADRRPARLDFAQGQVTFAANRRVLVDGKCTRIGVNLDGPVDHDLPLLRVTDPEGNLRGVLVNYACHCTTVRSYQIHGDWAGSAQLMIEGRHPGAIAMVAAGCGGDANPEPFKEEFVDQHGRAVADEVDRLLKGPLRPVRGLPVCRLRRIDLPFERVPTRAEWEELAQGDSRGAYQAKVVLERLDRGIEPAARLSYPVQTWAFGDDLTMVFLAGEVVVDYSLRLKRELGPEVWVTAYANDVPCYIASKRLMPEGGYEVDKSMISYDKPSRLAPETEELIISTVHKLLSAAR